MRKKKEHRAKVLDVLEREATDILLVDFGGVISRCRRTKRCRQTEREFLMVDGLVDWLFAAPTSVDALTHATPYMDILRELSVYRRIDIETIRTIMDVYAEANALDTILLAALQRCRPVSKLYILSNYWSNGREFITSKLDVHLFDGLFISAEIGLKKPDPRLWTYLSETLMRPTSSMTLIDDDAENIDGASKAGLKAYLWI
ncbi:HAD-IA family hydrolase [Rhizobium ruizarguesonis]|uniref:HAD-IA family hydrolase n=1 Tax=Rhizobium ruizarguesonis TaxID=2081791 RepID=UPI00372073E7